MRAQRQPEGSDPFNHHGDSSLGCSASIGEAPFVQLDWTGSRGPKRQRGEAFSVAQPSAPRTVYLFEGGGRRSRPPPSNRQFEPFGGSQPRTGTERYGIVRSLARTFGQPACRDFRRRAVGTRGRSDRCRVYRRRRTTSRVPRRAAALECFPAKRGPSEHRWRAERCR